MTDETRVCTACFLECEYGRANMAGGGFPCRVELREWAEKHRDDPAGLVIERRPHDPNGKG